MRPLLGTYVEIGVAQGECAEVVVSKAFEVIEEVQRRLSFHDPESDLSRLNGAGGKPVSMPSLSLRVLCLARAMTRASSGLFNCTVGGTLVRLGILPDHGGTSSLEHGSAEDIEIAGAQCRLQRPVLITLDGIAKGYAVDCAISVLRRNGVTSGWINAGGDLRVFGEIVLPVQRREPDGSFSHLGGLKDAAIATSCVQPSPDAAFPAWIVGHDRAPEMGVWTVMSHAAWRADALTKVAAVANVKERAGIIERLGGRLVEPVQEVALCA